MAADELADRAFAAAASAYAGTCGEWEAGVRAAISALFEFLAANADEATACLAADDGDPARLDRRDRTIARFAALLAPGPEPSAAPPAPVVIEAIGGGVYEVVRAHAREARLAELPDAAPAAAIVALTPFLGPDLAAERARTTRDAD